MLKYSWKHKIPEQRSTLTYWENDIPSRIDLGKDKYGGPFTYEEVENVKRFFRLLLLILSLFGFQLSGDGYSLTQYIINRAGCPSIIPYWLLINNPQHIPSNYSNTWSTYVSMHKKTFFTIYSKYVDKTLDWAVHINGE